MATTTVTLTTMDSPSPSNEASCISPARIVRFDSECVLIPDLLPTASSSKLPLVLTKSYSLPLWKKAASRHTPTTTPIDEGSTIDGSPRPRSPSPEDARVVIKVPIPVFRRRASRSPGPHARSLSTSPTVPRTLPSCLVHRSPTAASPSTSSSATSISSPPLAPVRRVSLPSHTHVHPPVLTIPLRACCAACEAATEHALAEGDQWKEHFSRGARRRRSASLESHQSYNPLSSSSTHLSLLARTMSPPPPITHTFAGISSAIDGVAHPRGLNMVRGDAAAVTAFALRVDEVDKRRRPSSTGYAFSNEEGHYAALRAAGVEVGGGDGAEGGSSTATSSGSSNAGSSTIASTSGQKQPLYQAARRASATASSSSSSPPSPSYCLTASPSPTYASPYLSSPTSDAYRLRASPIAEEDSEDGGSRRSSVSALVTASALSVVSVSVIPVEGETPPLVSSGAPRVGGVRSASGGSSRTARSGPYVQRDDDDDEADLFPLPRRSPSSSPSPRASPVPSLDGRRVSPSPRLTSSPRLGLGLSSSSSSSSLGLGGSSSSSPSGSTSSLLVPGVERRVSAGRGSPLVSPTEATREAGRREVVEEKEDEEMLGPSLSRRPSTITSAPATEGADDVGAGKGVVRVDAASAISSDAAPASLRLDTNTLADAKNDAKLSSTTERRPMSPRGPRPSQGTLRRDSVQLENKVVNGKKEAEGLVIQVVSASSASPAPTGPSSHPSDTPSSPTSTTSLHVVTPIPIHPTISPTAMESQPLPALPAGALPPIDVHNHTHHLNFHLPSFHPTHTHTQHTHRESEPSAAHHHAHSASLSSSTSSSSSSTTMHHPETPKSKRKTSFSSSLAALRVAGADVLKGVSAAAMGMSGPGVGA
ncbi:hypothetical protein BDN70DRAFT_991168 [Pholiota conissans]|uniref:Uncharacterized protein n=1 Tax=Pholiota conissans TaxID=109636 RepID=A0A9P5Z8Y1_9AGAR|nr:hypothetical protein BDN70DRAFT_991168 [Pholiota conissans]